MRASIAYQVRQLGEGGGWTITGSAAKFVARGAVGGMDRRRSSAVSTERPLIGTSGPSADRCASSATRHIKHQRTLPWWKHGSRNVTSGSRS
jgi:hypothetical protein